VRYRRLVIALAVTAMGIVNLSSALLSHPPDRLQALRHLVPTEVLDTSRTFTLLSGTLLLVTGWGLARGKRRAYVAALFLCALSVPINVLKALDVEEAAVAAAVMFLLGVHSDAFRVKSREWTLADLRSGTIWLGIALVIYSVLGCWVLERRYGEAASPGRAALEAAHRLLGVGAPALVLSPTLPQREVRVVEWFLGSLPLTGLTLLAGLAIAFLRPVAHRARHRGEIGRVKALVRDFGLCSVAPFAAVEGNDYFFSPNGRAVIAYRFESNTLLAVGEPLGPAEEIGPTLERFADFCAEHDWRFAFFQTRAESLPHFERLGWHAVHIGEEPVIPTDRFTLEGSAMGDVRRAVYRAEKGGLAARMVFPDSGGLRALPDGEDLLAQLKVVSAEWMRGRRGGEKGFCMSRFDAAALQDAWLAVAWDQAARRAEAFVTWVPLPARRGWVLDLMRRRAEAPSGSMELLVAKSVEAARARGDAFLSLALAPLAQVPEGVPAGAGVQADPAREFLVRHLAAFYDFKNLFRWKRKFQPAFEDRHLVYPDPLSLMPIAVALVRAQSPGGLRAYVRSGGGEANAAAGEEASLTVASPE
jgi:phosphatidylglycerol lysyltransferase